jgi:hypothetical protein
VVTAPMSSPYADPARGVGAFVQRQVSEC